MQKWLVTGAAGFIGYNLCRRLIADGVAVVGIDNFYSGTRDNIERLQRLAARRNQGGFRFVEADIRDRTALDALVQGMDCVVHLAAQVSVQRSMVAPEENHDINVTGFLCTLCAAGKASVPQFVYASSCAVYGDNRQLPLSEDSPPSPQSPYAASKLENEIIAMGMHNVHPGMVCTGLRFFNVFGPWQSLTGGYAAVIPSWISALFKGERPVIFGDGKATRDFCYVENICDAIVAAAKRTSPAAPAAFNVGTGTETSLLQLYQAISNEMASAGLAAAPVPPEHRDWRTGDIVRSVADISRSRKVLGYSPNVDLPAGLAYLIAHEREKRQV